MNRSSPISLGHTQISDRGYADHSCPYFQALNHFSLRESSVRQLSTRREIDISSMSVHIYRFRRSSDTIMNFFEGVNNLKLTADAVAFFCIIYR